MKAQQKYIVFCEFALREVTAAHKGQTHNCWWQKALISGTETINSDLKMENTTTKMENKQIKNRDSVKPLCFNGVSVFCVEVRSLLAQCHVRSAAPAPAQRKISVPRARIAAAKYATLCRTASRHNRK